MIPPLCSRRARLAGWLAIVALIELATRTLVYALAANADPMTVALRGDLGGPRPVIVAVVAITLAAALSAGLVGLAWLGVHERHALASPRPTAPPPRPPIGRILVRASVLWVVGMVVFGAVENYIHWRAGLGFHGLACLVGPVHVNAIPVSGALALLSAAAITAGAYLLRWMGTTLREVLPAPRPRRRATAAVRLTALTVVTSRADGPPPPARGPPLVVA